MSNQVNKNFLKSSHFISDLKLCEIRMINNSKFPWIILIPKRKDQLAFLKAFNDKNADKMMQMKKTLEGYAKGLRWFSNFEAEKRALLHINLNDKLNNIKDALKSIEKDVTSSHYWK